MVPFAGALMDLSRESGIPIKIRACDTMGYGVSYPGTALPRSVQGIIYGLRHYAEVPSEQLEWHGHNDFYKVVSNAATAWLHGCSSINCSLLGIGERTGNCPLEAMAIEYQSLRGDDGGMDIHADGMLKDEEIYNIFNTAKLLNRPASVAVDSRGGTASIAHWLNNYFRLTGDNTIDKNDPLIVDMRARVDDLYAKGRNTVMGDEELEVMVRRCDQNRYEKLLFHKSK